MNVIIACERSGMVRRAFRAKGHNAISVDLEPADDGAGTSRHHVGDAIDVPAYHYELGMRIDLMIAHPPCTFLSSSGLHWNKRRPERAAQTDAAVAFVLRLIDLYTRGVVERLAIENPVGCLSTRIRKPDQIIQPWQFGADASKATCLWLYGLPQLEGAEYVAPRIVCGRCRAPGDARRGCPECGAEAGLMRPRWSNQTDSGQNRLAPSKVPGERARLRSQTYPGIAAAMADQWGTPNYRSTT